MGRFCHVCGQQNLELKETFGGLVAHVISDIFHFDGKFFSTIRHLMFKPGYLTLAYSAGKRMTYLNPVKMYVFTSALFFFIFFNWEAKPALETIGENRNVGGINRQLDLVPKASAGNIASGNNPAGTVDLDIDLFGSDSAAGLSGTSDSVSTGSNMERRFMQQLSDLRARYKSDEVAMLKAGADKFLKALPQLMFASMPFMALFISLLYFRNPRSSLVYNGIWVMHVYTAMYLIILMIMAAAHLYALLGWQLLDLFQLFFGLYLLYYIYKSLRVYFGQTRAWAVFSFSALTVFSIFVFTLLTVVFALKSFFEL